jgi:hypothetical protein
MRFKHVVRVGAVAGAAVLMHAGPAFAHDCVNLSKNPASPTVTFGAGDGCGDALSAKNGVQNRIDKFGFDAEGNPNFQFHGPIGLDFNCDGAADAVTYEPGGDKGVIPAAHGANGSNRVNCKGLMAFEDAVANGCIG